MVQPVKAVKRHSGKISPGHPNHYGSSGLPESFMQPVFRLKEDTMSGFTATVNTLAAVTAVEQITNINNAVNGFVWGLPMLILLVGTGILMTLLTKFFQITHIRHWFSKTIGAVFTDRHVTAHTAKDDKSISQFQSLCTALAATIGTGNIAGVAAAIVSGGPGAIFWMWIVSFFGNDDKLLRKRPGYLLSPQK